jgi:molybdopterin-guanine dinucleotide biosynthesis protein A
MTKGGRAVDGWRVAVNVVPVDFDDPIAFRNVNTMCALAGGAL